MKFTYGVVLGFVVGGTLAVIMAMYSDFSSPSYMDEVQRRTDAPTFVKMKITHYDAGECCCGKWADGLTASGVPAVGLIVAADTDYYPFGTKMTIDGVTYTVQDRGGAIKGPYRLDILCKTHAEAIDRGVITRIVTVERKVR